MSTVNRRGQPSISYAAERIRGILSPPLHITEPPEGIVRELDIPVTMADGVKLRVNVFRPEGDSPVPVIMCAHPYGKDAFPQKGLFGYRPPAQYRLLRHPEPITFSALTTWEAPDPAFWVPRGYAVVNCDLRGFFRSEGVGEVLSAKEAEDYYALIEWAGTQPWCTGAVGLNGVSYLAISQWRVASLHPPHLRAICPWEGFTDVYRDLAYPGGVREDGFLAMWSSALEKGGRTLFDVRKEQLAHPEWDDFWAAHVPRLEEIEVPALICASFSDHNLHSRGAFEGYRRIRSQYRYLYTHRGGKWSTYYGKEALAAQLRFFDCFLKGEDNGQREWGPVRLEVREGRDKIHSVREEPAWPPPRAANLDLYLCPDGTLSTEPAAREVCKLELPSALLSWSWTIPYDLEVVGPMELLLTHDGQVDANLFAAVRKLRGEDHVVFEGSYGFGCDAVTHGSRRIRGGRAGGEECATLELLPSATFFSKGETLRLDLTGRWLFRKHPLLGQFPADYEPSKPGKFGLGLGGHGGTRVRVPVIRTTS